MNSHFANILSQMDRLFGQIMGFLAACALQLSRSNYAKINVMNRRNKLMPSVIATCLLTSLVAPKVHAKTVRGVVVYAGPQSVSPREIIHVTVEITGMRGNNINDETVNLSYMSDGVVKTLSGTPRHGLVSFDLPAQDTVGLMKFSANTKIGISGDALVTVVAAPPQPFSLKVQAGKHKGSIKLMSDVIADEYGNPVSDLSLISVDWIDDAGLKARQNTQLLNNRILLTGTCPSKFYGALKVRANLNGMQSAPVDISSYCELGRG